VSKSLPTTANGPAGASGWLASASPPASSAPELLPEPLVEPLLVPAPLLVPEELPPEPPLPPVLPELPPLLAEPLPPELLPLPLEALASGEPSPELPDPHIVSARSASAPAPAATFRVLIERPLFSGQRRDHGMTAYT
jgi:hypothetical protein